MSSETKANLIFLAILLAVTIPGGVMLVKKRLEPGRPSMALPDAPPPARLPYLAQREAPGVDRYEPEQTRTWLRDQVLAHSMAVFSRGGRPAISGDRTIQVVALRAVNGGTELGLVNWDPDAIAANPTISTTIAGQPISTVVTSTVGLDVPEAVIRELSYAGMVRVPRHVVWVNLTITAELKPERSTLLTIGYTTRGGDGHTSINLFEE